MHISDVSVLLVCSGLGTFISSWVGGLLADCFSSSRLLPLLLVTLLLIQLTLPLLTTTIIGGALTLFLWAMSFGLLFIPQQRHLLNTAPEHANVILALNNATFQMGIAIGAAVGGLALHSFAITQLAWVGMISIFLALLIVAISPLQNGERPQVFPDSPE